LAPRDGEREIKASKYTHRDAPPAAGVAVGQVHATLEDKFGLGEFGRPRGGGDGEGLVLMREVGMKKNTVRVVAGWD